MKLRYLIVMRESLSRRFTLNSGEVAASFSCFIVDCITKLEKALSDSFCQIRQFFCAK